MPLESLDIRYTTHLDRDIRLFLFNNSVNHKRLTPKTIGNKIKVDGMFLDADDTVYRQMSQFQELIKGLVDGSIPKGSEIFISDIWNFGVMCIPYLNYFSKHNLKVSGILHAGSFTDTDFVRKMERVYKGFEESILDICEEVFVGSNFIKKDVLSKRFVDSEKIKVTGLPLDFVGMKKHMGRKRKQDIVVFNGRNVDEKQPHLFDELSKHLPGYQFVNTQKEKFSKHEYYDLLSRAKFVVSFALQENFGYGIQEAVALGCTPILPNRLCYIEQFSEKYRYNSFEDCCDMLTGFAEHYTAPPVFRQNNNDFIFRTWFKKHL